MKKIILSAALLGGLFLTAKAGPLNANTSTPSEVAATEQVYVYYIISQSGSTYFLSDNPADADPNCGQGTLKACQIQTNTEHPSLQISEALVNDPSETLIQARRD